MREMKGIKFSLNCVGKRCWELLLAFSLAFGICIKSDQWELSMVAQDYHSQTGSRGTAISTRPSWAMQ